MVRKQPAFVPNDLQRALFEEVMSGGPLGNEGAAALAKRPDVVHEWLSQMKPVLHSLASVAQAGLRHQDAITGFGMALVAVSNEEARWWSDKKCLMNLLSPIMAEQQSDEVRRVNLQKLATLDAGL